MADGSLPDACDVVVVGAGPAGSTAARVAAGLGAEVVLVDAARFPRYKTCGGGLIGTTLTHLPGPLDDLLLTGVRGVEFTARGRHRYRRDSAEPVLALTNRAELDAWLAERAVRSGARFLDGTKVTGWEDHGDRIRVHTTAGSVTTRLLVAADGTSSRIAHELGVVLQQRDLGLELEVDAEGAPGELHHGVRLDWGPFPGSYGWSFPKQDTVTIGVIAQVGDPAGTKEYLSALAAHWGVDEAAVRRSTGHLTRVRAPTSPLGRGGVLLTGDAAGLLEPWTREGISFAVRSGAVAGEVAASGAYDPANAAAEYHAALGPLLEEIAAGRELMDLFRRHPRSFHQALRTPVGWSLFRQISRGERTLADVMGWRVVRQPTRVVNRWGI